MYLLFSLVGFTVGVGGGVLTLAVSWFATRKAKQGAKSTTWFMLPPIVFTVIPLVLKIFGPAEAESVSFVELLLVNLTFVLGFLLPVMLLLVVYWRLSKLHEYLMSSQQT